MLDARASLNELLSRVDTLVDRSTKSAAAKIAAAQGAEAKSAALSEIVVETMATAKSAAAQLRSAAAAQEQKRAEKVAIARHIFRTSVRLAG